MVLWLYSIVSIIYCTDETSRFSVEPGPHCDLSPSPVEQEDEDPGTSRVRRKKPKHTRQVVKKKGSMVTAHRGRFSLTGQADFAASIYDCIAPADSPESSRVNSPPEPPPVSVQGTHTKAAPSKCCIKCDSPLGVNVCTY